MEYSRIVAVTGMPGLYEILNSKSDGAIVRSLDDGSTKFVSSRVHNLSHLESIEIYTTGENVPLSDVFAAMKASKESMPDVKDNKALKGYFEKVYPEMDTERVYSSDMKKMINWFGVLESHKVDFSIKEEPQDEQVEVEAEPEVKKEKTEKAPAKKAAKKSGKNVADTLEAAGEKVVLDVSADEIPEVAKTKTTKTRKKKTEE